MKKKLNDLKHEDVCGMHIGLRLFVLGDTYPAWPNSFKWVDGMFTMLKSQANGYKCAAFKEPKDAPWYDNFLCWKGDMAPNIKFSASGRLHF